MDEYVKQIRERRLAAAAAMKDTLNGAAAEKRELSAEERGKYEAAEADLDRLEAEEKRLLDASKKVEAADKLRESIATASAEIRDRAERPTETQVIKALRLGTYRSADVNEDGAEVRWSPGILNALNGPAEFRALTIAAGTTVAANYADFVTVYERTLNPMLDVARVITTADGTPITFPRLTADTSSGGTITAEAGTISEADPTISQVTLNAYKIAVTNLWSNELAQDNYVNLDQLVAETTARDIGLSWGTLFTTGSGTSQPKGFVTAASNGGTALGTAASGVSSDTFIGAADLVDLYYSLAAPYRTRGVFMAATTAIKQMRKFRDKNGQFLWEAASAVGQPDTFLARPVYENPAMATLASASKSVAFGDFSRYFIRQIPMRVDTSIHYKFNTDQFAVRTVTRRDGNLIDTAAVAYLVSANT